MRWTQQSANLGPIFAWFISGHSSAQLDEGWWHDLISDGSGGSTYVQARRGNLEHWDQWRVIRYCNPLVEVSAEFRRTLLEEREAARRDPRLKARFCSYRLTSQVKMNHLLC